MEVYSIQIPAYTDFVMPSKARVGTLFRDNIFEHPSIQELTKHNSAFALFFYFLIRTNPKTKTYEVEKEKLRTDLAKAGFENVLANIRQLEELKLCISKKIEKSQLTFFAEHDTKHGQKVPETKDEKARTSAYLICKLLYDRLKDAGRPLPSSNYHQNAAIFTSLVKEYGAKEVKASIDFFLNDTYWKENITGAHNFRNNFAKFHEWYLKTVKMPYPKNKEGLFGTNYEKLLYPADDKEIPYAALDFENKERRLMLKGLVNGKGFPLVDPSQPINKKLAYYIFYQYTERGKNLEPEWEPFYQAVLRDHKNNGNQSAERNTNEERDQI